MESRAGIAGDRLRSDFGEDAGTPRLAVQRQVAVPIEYPGETFSKGSRADLIVGERVIVELKSVEHVTPVHMKLLLTYLLLVGLKLGYLFNFGEALIRDGITRTTNGSIDP